MSDMAAPAQDPRTFLAVLEDPDTVRPTQDTLVRALQECTRFRLHHAPDSTPDRPHFSHVEFENEALAKKAFATVHSIPLGKIDDTRALTEQIKRDPPTGSKLLNVTELPPEYTSEQCYDVFAKFGPIFRCTRIAPGTCHLIFYSPLDADKAQLEMNFASLGSYQIIVRFPSKYDSKDSFKSGQLKGLGSVPGRVSASRRVASLGTPEKGSPIAGMPRSASGPVKLTDPVRLILQNVPLQATANELYSHFATFGDLKTAALAYDRVSHDSRKPLGIAVLVYSRPEEASSALHELNGKYLVPHDPIDSERFRASQPLYIRLWEPRGSLEKDLQVGEPAISGLALKADAAPFVPAGASTSSPERREVSFSSTSSTVVSPTQSQIVSFSAVTNAGGELSPEMKKHKRLLQTALEELPASVRRKIGTQIFKLERVADVLVRQLENEEDRKRCIFDEAFLMKAVRDALPLVDNGTTGAPAMEGDTSPTRTYDRRQLLQLYSTTSKTSENLDEVAAVITSPTGERSRSHSPTARVDRQGPNASDSRDMSLDTLSRFSASGLMSLARSPAPPSLLSRPLSCSAAEWEDKIAATDKFIAEIRGLKPSLQKQKIGERIFKLFKGAQVRSAETGEPESMRNVSKKTVSLLDGEDLGALAHLCDEFPEVLIAKAAAMDI